MNDFRFASRCLAALFLSQLVIGPIANFRLLGDAFEGKGGYLVNAAAHAASLSSAVLLTVALALTSAGIAVVLWPVLRPLSERMALALAILGAALVALAGMENASLLAMLSLSQAYAAAGSPDAALYTALRGVVSAPRNWSHLIHLLMGGLTLLAMYAALFRFRLVPRWLAGFGILASLSQMIAVTTPLYGGWVLFPLLAPLGAAQLLLTGWLLVKGLQPRGNG